jgi:Uma2 family endonuclease
MTSSKQLAKGGNQGRLESHLGNPETTIVSGERYICAVPGGPIRYPDLLVAFDADPELYEANNGYVVSFQGKPPELALEVASRHTWRADIEVKPDSYASLGVQEYWRFDETGEFHGARLAGDRLVDGQYHPIMVDELADGELRGYSETLGLYFCWRQGRLDWYDPSAEDYIPSLESERQLRQQAEERVRQLEAELRQRG